MATEITDREIVLHKLFSRLCNLLALVLAGLPVLMAVQFLGGIDPNLVLAGFAASAVTVLSLGSLSILLSVLARRPLEAIFGTYFWIAAAFLFFSCCPPGWFANPVFVFRKINARFGRSASLAEEFDLSMIADVLIAYGSLHLTFALFCVGLAILTVREAALREFGSAECADDTPPRFTQRDLNRLGLAASKLAESVILEQARPSQPSTDAVVAAMLRRRPMPIGDQPLLWRESRPFALDYLARHHPFFAFLTFLALGVILAASVVTLVITMTLDSSITEKSITLRTQTASAVALSVGCLLTGLSASTRITSERERRTLDMLLTAPVEHDEILLAKWLGSFLATKVAWLTLAVVWALGILAGGMQWLALPFTLTASAVHASFAAMFGLWCSARSPTTQRAVTITAASLIVIGVAPVGAAAVVSRLPDVPNPNKRWLVPLVVNLSPPMNLMQLTFVAPGRARNDEAIPSNMWDSPSLELSGTAWLPYVVATLLMWRSVRRRFRSELDQTTPSAAKLNTGEPERETWLRER
jgi:ABC-type transport system involved in multi-copper enzyme maturation permease subunit